MLFVGKLLWFSLNIFHITNLLLVCNQFYVAPRNWKNAHDTALAEPTYAKIRWVSLVGLTAIAAVNSIHAYSYVDIFQIFLHWIHNLSYLDLLTSFATVLRVTCVLCVKLQVYNTWRMVPLLNIRKMSTHTFFINDFKKSHTFYIPHCWSKSDVVSSFHTFWNTINK